MQAHVIEVTITNTPKITSPCMQQKCNTTNIYLHHIYELYNNYKIYKASEVLQATISTYYNY